MTETRIYCVSDGDTDRLVRAKTKQRAVRYVVTGKYQTRLATQDDIVLAMESGGKVEDAGDDAQTDAFAGKEK